MLVNINTLIVVDVKYAGVLFESLKLRPTSDTSDTSDGTSALELIPLNNVCNM
jgi:hypothetical protein